MHTHSFRPFFCEWVFHPLTYLSFSKGVTKVLNQQNFIGDILKVVSFILKIFVFINYSAITALKASYRPFLKT